MVVVGYTARRAGWLDGCWPGCAVLQGEGEGGRVVDGGVMSG